MARQDVDAFTHAHGTIDLSDDVHEPSHVVNVEFPYVDVTQTHDLSHEIVGESLRRTFMRNLSSFQRANPCSQGEKRKLHGP